MLQDRAGIIVLREDLDFYVIPPKPDIEGPEMVEVKRAAGKALLEQNGIFSGLRRSEESGTTEQHLIEMLTAGYVDQTPRSHSLFLLRFQSLDADACVSKQRLQQRRLMGPSGIRAPKGGHLLVGTGPAPDRHQGQRCLCSKQQQRGGHGTEAAALLAETGAEMLVGRGGAGGRGRGGGQAEGLDPAGVDFGDGRLAPSRCASPTLTGKANFQ